MKIKILLILLLFCNICLAQTKREFSELRGFEDKNGNTHLFYRILEYKTSDSPYIISGLNNVYHLDLSTKKDSLFLHDFDSLGYFEGITDYDFWHNDPAKYIYCGYFGGFDASSFIQRFDGDKVSQYLGGSIRKIFISRQNDSLIFANNTDRVIIGSTDGGKKWEPVDNLSVAVALVSVSPFNDKNFFTLINYFYLSASTDGGQTFTATGIESTDKSKFFYDPDSSHVYAVISKGNGSISPIQWYLKVSDGHPNFYSFPEDYSIKPQLSEIFLAVDNSKSGTIYIAIQNRIYKSTDYGKTFTFYKAFQRKLIGLYKKPNSEVLYAETKYDLMAITPDSIKIIKHVQPPLNLLQWYPLTRSNKWFYKNVSTSFGEYSSGIVAREVIGDTILPNNTRYAVISEKYLSSNKVNYTLERIDSADGMVYRYKGIYTDLNNEIAWFDLTSELHDTLRYSSKGEYLNSTMAYYSDDNLTLNGTVFPRKNFKEVFSDPAGFYSLSENIGLSNYGYSGFQTENTNTLIGCIINGIVYGDTTGNTVGITEQKISVKEFSLSQNYPNPFNPTTVISYQLPVISHVTLKVYDILGNEIKTLVNEIKAPGDYNIRFDAGNLSAGVYMYRLTAGNFSAVKKLMLIK